MDVVYYLHEVEHETSAYMLESQAEPNTNLPASNY